MKKAKRRDLRIFFNGNAPYATSGYAQWHNNHLSRFVRDGWPTAMSCYYGLEGGELDYNGIHLYPKMGDTWGADCMVFHANKFRADTVITHMDVWVLNPQLLAKTKNWIPYVPIDHSPVPPAVLDKLRFAYRILTMSKFGKKELEKAGFSSTYIPQGVDTSVFKPMDRKKLRESLGIRDDVFVFGMVGANKDNPPRKGFQEAMDAFKLFTEKHPNSVMFIHTLLQQQGGFPIVDYAKSIGIDNKLHGIEDYTVIWGTPHDGVAREMNCFDVLLQPSSNEGFGMPIIEAQACGVPVIVNNTTAMPELVIEGVTGEICQAGQPRWTPLGAYVAHADTQSLYEKMEVLYERLQKPNTIAKDCRDFIVENFEIDKVVKEYWVPLFIELQDELLPLKNEQPNATLNPMV